jgi:hypothetical protein
MKNTQPDRYGAAQKCRAVLAVWMERKKASTLCRELEVSASLFSQWQDRALSGMLEALEPRGQREGVEGPALPVTIRRLLDRKVRAQELLNLSRTTHYRRRPEKLPTPSAVPASGTGS